MTLENVSCGLSDGKISLPAATVLVRSAISLAAASLTNVGSSALVLGSLAEGAGPALIIPADCKAPEMAWEITAVSSVELNCEEDGVAGVDSGRVVGTLSARRRFAGTAGVRLLAAWRLEARLEGMLMRNGT